MSRNIKIPGEATRADDVNYSINTVSDEDYDGTSVDGYDEIWMDATSANREYTVPDPTDSSNLNRIITIVKVSTGAYHVDILPYDTEVFISQGKEFSSLSAWLPGDRISLLCDGINWRKINSPYWHLMDESSRSTSVYINVNPTTSWAEANLSSNVPSGTLAIYGLMSIVLADADGIILLRDGTSSETNQIRTRSLGNFSSAGNVLRVPLIIKAKNGIFDYAEFSSAAELSNITFLLWGWLQ